MNRYTPAQFVSALKERDSDAVGELIDALRDRSGYLLAKAGDDADDILQEALLDILTGLESLNEPRFLLAWCNTIINRKVDDLLKQRMRERRVVVPISESTEPSGHSPVFEQIYDQQRSRILTDLLAGLEPEQMDIVRRNFEQQPHQQIEEELGITHDALRGRRKRILQWLRAQYRQQTEFSMTPMPLRRAARARIAASTEPAGLRLAA